MSLLQVQRYSRYSRYSSTAGTANTQTAGFALVYLLSLVPGLHGCQPAGIGCARDPHPTTAGTRAGAHDAPGVGPSRPWALCGRGGGPGGGRGPRGGVWKVVMGQGGRGLRRTIPQGGATAMAALLGPLRDALCSKPENSKRLYQHLRHTISCPARRTRKSPSSALERRPRPCGCGAAWLARLAGMQYLGPPCWSQPRFSLWPFRS